MLFTSRAGIGNTAILDKESATNQGFQPIVPKANLLDTYFIYSKSHLLKRYGEVNGAGSTFVEVSGKEMSKMPLSLPTIKEQIQIGRLFKAIDNNIVLHQRKYTQLIRLKKAYLEKIFNQELVFKNEKSIWEEKKFEEFMYKPEKLLKASNIRKNELLTVKLFGKGVEIANQNRSLKLGATTYYKRFAGDFIYGKQNFFNGAFGFISENLDGYYSSGDVPTLKFNSKIVDRPFFLNYISREIYYKRTEAYSSGTGSKRIHEDTLLEFKIKVPLISEQRRIVFY